MDAEELYHEIVIMRDQELVISSSRYTEEEDMSEDRRTAASAKRGRAGIRAQAFQDVLDMMEKEGIS